jgi:hypothetical protein
MMSCVHVLVCIELEMTVFTYAQHLAHFYGGCGSKAHDGNTLQCCAQLIEVAVMGSKVVPCSRARDTHHRRGGGCEKGEKYKFEVTGAARTPFGYTVSFIDGKQANLRRKCTENQ